MRMFAASVDAGHGCWNNPARPWNGQSSVVEFSRLATTAKAEALASTNVPRPTHGDLPHTHARGRAQARRGACAGSGGVRARVRACVRARRPCVRVAAGRTSVRMIGRVCVRGVQASPSEARVALLVTVFCGNFLRFESKIVKNFLRLRRALRRKRSIFLRNPKEMPSPAAGLRPLTRAPMVRPPRGVAAATRSDELGQARAAGRTLCLRRRPHQRRREGQDDSITLCSADRGAPASPSAERSPMAGNPPGGAHRAQREGDDHHARRQGLR